MDFSHVQQRLQKPTTKANNERASLIEPFVKRLNASRERSGYKPYSAKFVAMKMSHIDTGELHYFYKKLSEANNFCSLWHYYCTCPNKKKK